MVRSCMWSVIFISNDFVNSAPKSSRNAGFGRIRLILSDIVAGRLISYMIWRRQKGYISILPDFAGFDYREQLADKCDVWWLGHGKHSVTYHSNRFECPEQLSGVFCTCGQGITKTKLRCCRIWRQISEIECLEQRILLILSDIVFPGIAY